MAHDFVPTAVLYAVIARCMREDKPCCEMCGDPLVGERGVSWALHHRRFRSGRPDDHTTQNLLAVHGASNVDSCHGYIHRNKGEAMIAGWAITRHGNPDPRRIPVLIDNGSRWTYLDEHGAYVDDPEATP
jgi:hypothetical protein